MLRPLLRRMPALTAIDLSSNPHPHPNPKPNPHPIPSPNPHPNPSPNPHPNPNPNQAIDLSGSGACDGDVQIIGDAVG